MWRRLGWRGTSFRSHTQKRPGRPECWPDGATALSLPPIFQGHLGDRDPACSVATIAGFFGGAGAGAVAGRTLAEAVEPWVPVGPGQPATAGRDLPAILASTYVLGLEQPVTGCSDQADQPSGHPGDVAALAVGLPNLAHVFRKTCRDCDVTVLKTT